MRHEDSEQALIILRKLNAQKGETVTYFTDFWKETFDIRNVLPVELPATQDGQQGPIVVVRRQDAINDLKARYGFHALDEIQFGPSTTS